MKYLLLPLLMILSAAAMAVEPRTGHLHSDTRSLSGVFSSICQDRDGFMWIGTDRGLLRFDGNSYDIYRHDDGVADSLSDSRILGVLCDSKGRVWVATANGLNLYNPADDSFQVIPIPAMSFLGYIISLTEQPDGTITFLMSGVGLYVVSDKDGNPQAVRYGCGDEERDFNMIAAAPSGTLFISDRNGFVYSMAKNGRLTRYAVSPSTFISSIAVEADGNLLVAVYDAVYRLDARSGEVSRLHSEGLASISSLSNTSGSEVYVATEGRGVWKVATGSDTVAQCPDLYCPFLDIAAAKVGVAYCAPDGNLWLGCNYAGLVVLPEKKIPFVYRRISESIPDFTGGVGAMGIWKENLVVGLDKGRVAVFSPEGRLLKKAAVPIWSKITDIQISGDYAILGVEHDGVWQLDLNSGAARKLIDIRGKYSSVMTAPGNHGELFVGGHGAGVMRVDLSSGEQDWLPIDRDGDQLTNAYVTCLERTPDDKLWIGFFSGIACYDLKTRKLLHIDQQPFLKGATFAIAPCLTDNSVWVGTSHGLIHFDAEKGVLDKLTVAEGLTNNDIRTIERDASGAKWMGTMDGLSYVPASNDSVLGYLGGMGLVERPVNELLFSPDNGIMYAASDLGITAFRPESIRPSGFASPVTVSGIYLNGRRLVADTEIDGRKVIKGSPLAPEAIYLPHHDNALSLRMSTMDFRDATNISYMWRLGPDEAWIQCSPGQSVIYLPHLDSGTYSLEISARENNETSPPVRISICIAQPWYHAWWAKAGLAVLIAALLALAAVVMRKRRKEEINENKLRMFTDISHDIRSPMTLILSPLEALMKEVSDPSQRLRLGVMHRNARRILGLVNQMLDIQKLEKGKVSLACRKTDIDEFVGGLVDLFRPQAEEKHIDLSYLGSETMGEVWLDRENFDKILVNIISNAIKFTPAGGAIEVALDETADDRLGICARVRVSDTGPGLDEKTRKRLFERFYQGGGAAPGFGIGLDLCRRLARLHHGSVSGDNRNDGTTGCVFSVIIPLDENHYADSEKIAAPDDCFEASEMARDAVARPSATDRPKPASSGMRVLVVDDDADLRAYLKAELEKYYSVREAANGAEALRIIADWNPDVVVSDVMMQEMDGLTLLKRLKAGAATNHIPVVLLSSKVDLSDRMAGWDKGADGYLGKPFSIDELISLVDTLIENRRRMRGKFSGAQDTEGKIDAPEMKGNDEVLLERIQKVINRYIDDPKFNVEKLSAEVGVSRAQLHRKMKELLGLTPSDYIRNIRLARACELLKKPDIEVTQVAYQIGFASQPHFSSHFKKYTGFTPSEYRSKNI